MKWIIFIFEEKQSINIPLQMFKYIVLSFFLINTIIAKAQFTPTQILSVKDGLSQGMIYDIEKDKDGFMWFGTKNGLNRYDGYNFKVFTNDPFDSTSLSGDIISELLIDAKNRLWVVVGDRELNLYNKQKEQFRRIVSANILISDTEGTIWAAGKEKLYKITTIAAKSDKFQVKATVQAQFPIGHRIIALFEDEKEKLIIATKKNGLYLFDKTTNELKPIFQEALKGDYGVKSFVKTDKGELWFTSFNKLYLIRNQEIKSYTLIANNSNKKLTRLRITLNPITKKIWLTSEFHRITYEIIPTQNFDNVQLQPVFTLDKKMYPTNFYFENDRNLWIGTNGFGVRKKHLRNYPFQHLAVGESVRKICLTDDGKMLLKAFESNSKGSAFTSDSIQTYVTGIKGAFYGASKTKDGTIWAISLEALGKEDDEVVLSKLNNDFSIKNTYPLFNLNIEPIFGQFIEDKNGFLWLPTRSHNLIRFNIATKSAQVIENEGPITINFVTYFLYQDSKGTIWNCTEKGLGRTLLDRNSNKTHYHFYQTDPSNRESISNNVVSAVLDDPIDPDTYIWVATKGGGINKFNKQTEKFEHFTTKDGLPDNVVYGILADEENNLWLSTNRGLSRFNPTTKKFTNFVKADGLQDDEFNTSSFLKNEKTGKLYFGGINGITAFHPKDIQFSNFEPNVYINQLKIHGEVIEVGKTLQQRGNNPLTQPIEFTKKIRLPWYQNQITLDFAALDFEKPEKNLYEYQLSSVDKNWIKAGTRRSANYSNLNVGNYTFRLKGTNSDGLWSTQTVTLKIIIYPPWWRTYWAYGGYLMLFLWGIYSLYQNQVQRAQLHNKLAFEQKEATRLAELDKIKTNFFSNITHEFRTPLTLIIEPLNQVLDNNILPWRPKVVLARRNSQRLLTLVNQLLDLSKLESKKMNLELKRGDILEFFAPIIASFQTLAQQKNIQLLYNAPEELPFFDFDKNKLEKIVFNLVSNAIKFTPNNGTITINIKEKINLQQLHLQVIDTGIGIAPKEQPFIFDRFYQVDGSNTRKQEGTGIGLALCKELTEIMNGSLTFQSTLGKGSTFEVNLPMINATTTLKTSPQPLSTPSITPTFLDNLTTPILSNPIKVNPDATNIALIIEDNAELRAFVKSSIKHQYQVLEAANGQEGLNLALQHIPNIIISDVMMPVMDGFEVCKKTKTNEKTAHIPVILLTAKTAMDSRIKGLKYGADAYMNKPFSTEELIIRMDNLIKIREKLQAKFSKALAIPKNKTTPSIKKSTIKKSPKVVDDALSSFDQRFIDHLHSTVEKHLDDENLTVELLAQKAGSSKSQLHRKLRGLLNQSPSEFIRNIRLKAAYEFLQDGKGNVTEVAFMVGFSSQKYFSTKFKEKYGISPSKI